MPVAVPPSTGTQAPTTAPGGGSQMISGQPSASEHWVAHLFQAALTAVASFATTFAPQPLLQVVGRESSTIWHWLGALGLQARAAFTAAA
jgi:hypothetical protein